MYNTNSSASSYEFGTIATYICDTSYVLSVTDLKPRVCSGDSVQGVWNGNTPICKCKDVYFNHTNFVVTLHVVVLFFCGIFFICVQIVITIFTFPYLKQPNYELAIDHYNMIKHYAIYNKLLNYFFHA